MRQIPSLRPRPREGAGPTLNPPDEPKSVFESLDETCQLLDETEGQFFRQKSIEIAGEYLCNPFRDEYAKAKAVREFMALIDLGEKSINEAVESRRLPPADWEKVA